MTSFIWQYLRNQWLISSDSKYNLLRKGSTLTLPKRFIKICPFFMTWKSANFLYPPSQQKRERDDPHKILKMGSLRWVMIVYNEIKKLRLVTELYMQKWLDNIFASKCNWQSFECTTHPRHTRKYENTKNDRLLPGVLLLTWCAILLICVCVSPLVHPLLKATDSSQCFLMETRVHWIRLLDDEGCQWILNVTIMVPKLVSDSHCIIFRPCLCMHLFFWVQAARASHHNRMIQFIR